MEVRKLIVPAQLNEAAQRPPLKALGPVPESAGRLTLARVALGAEEEELVLRVLRSGHLAQGPMVARFEQAFAEVVQTRHAVAVSSGTTALVASLQALGVGPGDEVITGPITFGATLNAILEVGATARFADVSEDGTMDPGSLAERITPNTRAVIPVHIYGYAADMEEITSEAWPAGLDIVEDACQAVGATSRGRPVGSYGLGCFSLYATKNITTGEGGMITTDDDLLAERIRLLRGQGMRDRYSYEIPGHNYRMTDVQAAIGIPQLDRLESVTAARRDNAAVLTEGLAGLPGLRVPQPEAGRDHVYHHYVVRTSEDSPVSRADLMSHLEAHDIESGLIYPRLVFDYPCYLQHPRVVADDVPVAARFVNEALALPVHPGLSHADVERIVDAVRSALT